MSTNDQPDDVTALLAEFGLESDERWRALAEGHAPPEIVERLRAESEPDPVLGNLFALLAPLPEAFHAQTIERVAEAFHRGSSWPPWQFAAVTLVVALAAMALLFLRPESSAVPDYTVSFESEVLAAGESMAVLQVGQGFELLLFPDPPTDEPVELKAFVDTWEATGELDIGPVDPGDRGEFRVRGVVGEPPFELEPGRHDLRFAIGLPGTPFREGDDRFAQKTRSVAVLPEIGVTWSVDGVETEVVEVKPGQILSLAVEAVVSTTLPLEVRLFVDDPSRVWPVTADGEGFRAQPIAVGRAPLDLAAGPHTVVVEMGLSEVASRGIRHERTFVVLPEEG